MSESWRRTSSKRIRGVAKPKGPKKAPELLNFNQITQAERGDAKFIESMMPIFPHWGKSRKEALSIGRNEGKFSKARGLYPGQKSLIMSLERRRRISLHKF